MAAVDLFRTVIRPVKPLLSATVLRPGRVVPVLRGPSKGLRYRVFPDYGLAPIYGGWEPDLQRVAAETIKPGAVVYDIGASYGIHTILFARLAGPTGRVFAFEPVPDFAAELEANVRLNHLTNVECVTEAVDDRVGKAMFVLGHNTAAGHLQSVDNTGDAGSGPEVRTTTLDDFVFARGCPPPTFIKMDVEGAEGAVLRGGGRVLSEVRPVLLIDLHTPEQDREVGRALLANNYRARRTDSEAWIERLDLGTPDPRGIFGQVVAFPE